MDSATINARIRVGKEKGTIRFIGPVQPTMGSFYGIDWDNIDRGKHDGTFNGERYFFARGPNSGSFIKWNDKIRVGKTLMKCVQEKYADGSREYSNSFKLGNKNVELVGFDKIAEKRQNLSQFYEIILDDLDVSSIGNDNLSEIFPILREVCLPDTLINDWKEILLLCHQIKNLRLLDISKNFFDWSTTSDTNCEQFRALETLIFNEAALTSDNLKFIARCFPGLTRLDIAQNQIGSVKSLCNMEDLVQLDLQLNPINDWQAIMALGTLKYLKQLNLKNTGITDISSERPTDQTNETPPFPSLQQLNLSENKINSWHSIDELNKLNALENLLLSNNPIVEQLLMVNSDGAKFKPRNIIIAKISRLKILDKCEINKNERYAAEAEFSKYSAEKIHNEQISSSFVDKEPESSKCNHKLSTNFVDTMHQIRSSSLKTVKNLIFKFDGREPIEKKVSVEMTVLKLRFLAARLFGTSPLAIKLSYENISHPGVIRDMDNDTRKLDFYSIENGDIIYVNCT